MISQRTGQRNLAALGAVLRVLTQELTRRLPMVQQLLEAGQAADTALCTRRSCKHCHCERVACDGSKNLVVVLVVRAGKSLVDEIDLDQVVDRYFVAE